MKICQPKLPLLIATFCFLAPLSSGGQCMEEEFDSDSNYHIGHLGLPKESEEPLVFAAFKENCPEQKDHTLVVKEWWELNRLWDDKHESPPYRWYQDISNTLFLIEKSEIDGYYTLKNQEVSGFIVCVQKEYAAGKKDHTLVIRDWAEYKPGGKWREDALFSIKKSENKEYYTLSNKKIQGLVTYVPKEHAPEQKDHTLVIRNWDEYKAGGEWRNAALFSFSKK